MLIELQKPIPGTAVSLLDKDDKARRCEACFMLDYSPEHNSLWGCFMNDDGSFWWVPNQEFRRDKNWSLGRR